MHTKRITKSEYTVDPDGINNIDSCDCCGNASRTVWGYVRRGGICVAAYFVHWTVGKRDHGANFDLIVGRWGDDSSARDRNLVSLVYRKTDDGSGFMVVDSENRPAAESDLVGHALTREDVIGTELAQQAFDIIDAIWLQDNRIEDIRRF